MSVNGFHEVRLPDQIEKGAQGSAAGFNTSILALSSGNEKRNINWSKNRGSWNVAYGIQSKEDMQEVIDFFYCRYGRGFGFRFKDWTDYEIGKLSVMGGVNVNPQTIFTGDGVTTAIQINKVYSDGTYSFTRKITKIVAGTLIVYVNGVAAVIVTDYTVDLNTGIITFLTPPGTRATSVLTTSDNPSDGETVTLNGKTYTFQNSLTNADGHVKIAASETLTLVNLLHAINKSGGVIGTDYATATTTHPTIEATASAAHTMNVRARTAGTAGNALTLADTLGGSDGFAAATLTGGANGVVSIQCEFDVPVRFDTDNLTLEAETYAAMAATGIMIAQLKE